MPGRQAVTYAGLKFEAQPDFWLRRWTCFPFYFESTNPAFRVRITRVGAPPNGEQFRSSSIPFAIRFADDTVTLPQCPVPDLQIGQSVLWKVTGVYSPHPGR